MGSRDINEQVTGSYRIICQSDFWKSARNGHFPHDQIGLRDGTELHSLLRCITGGADLDQEQLVRGAMEWVIHPGKLPDEENMESGGMFVFSG